MNSTDANKLDDMLRKVQALLARADHPNTPVPEAESCRNKAEALMFKYRIEEASVASGSVIGASILPQWHTVLICSSRSEFATEYKQLAATAMAHVGIRGVFKHTATYDESGETNYVWQAEVVGYESDLRIFEVLYTSCMLAFQSKLEPKVDPNVSEQVNAYNMRNAGMEGWRIAQAIYGKNDKALRVKVRGLFKTEAVLRGEDPSILLGKGNSVKAFRKSYADGFVIEMHHRLKRMRMSRGENEVGLVLMSRTENINEAFYERYPMYRPSDGSLAPYKDPRDGCKKCKAAKSGYCREHGWMKPRYRTVKDTTNYTAQDRGRKAAQAVDLGRGGTGKVGSAGTAQPRQLG